MSVVIKNYVFIKKNEKMEISFLKEVDGLLIKKGSNLSSKIKVLKMRIFGKERINAFLKNKTKKKLEMYLNYLITYMEDGGEDGTTDLRHALNDLTRYKEILNTKYHKFLEKKYLELLMKKTAVLEEELKTRIIYEEMKMMSESTYDYEETKGKSR